MVCAVVEPKSEKFVVGCWFLVVGRWRKKGCFLFGGDFLLKLEGNAGKGTFTKIITGGVEAASQFEWK